MENLGSILKRAVGERQGPYTGAVVVPTCPICHDTKFVSRGTHYGQPGFGEVYPCVCQYQGVETLDNFNPNPQYADLVKALAAVGEWVAATGPSILVLSGERGVGKSHLALAARHALGLKGESCLCVTDYQLDQAIRKSFDNQITDEIIGGYAKAPRLIIDDFGTVARAETMKGLIDALFNERWIGARDGAAWTLITTNQSGADMTARIQSRLEDQTRSLVVVMDAPDYRKVVRGE